MFSKRTPCRSVNHGLTKISASPGRFMAADGIRLMLTHILGTMMWLPKAVGHGPRPANITFTKILLPDLNVEIMLRKIRT